MRHILPAVALPFLILVGGLYPTSALAHHAFAADYQAGNEGELEGTITEVIYKNPHARYYLEVDGESGDKELWDLQTMNLMMLGRVGWTKDTLRVGDKIKVEGILGRNNTKRMSINVVTHEDGRVISPQRGISESNVELGSRAAVTAAASDFKSPFSGVSPGRYELEENHAYVGFAYSHMGLSKPQLQFTDLDAELMLDPNDAANNRVSLTIDSASVVSASPELDDALRGDEFFNAAAHPTIEFAGSEFEVTGENQGRLHGSLSIAGHTQPVSLDVQINSAAMNPLNRREMVGVTVSGMVQRSDFGMTAYPDLVADDIALIAQLEFQKGRD